MGKKSGSKKNLKTHVDGVSGNERKMLGDDEMLMHFGNKEQVSKFTGKFDGH